MLDTQTIVASLLFGVVGFMVSYYGKKMSLWKPLVIGLTLMTYPYFTPNRFLLWGIGVGLLVLLWFHHDE